jgi:hypothetical protein
VVNPSTTSADTAGMKGEILRRRMRPSGAAAIASSIALLIAAVPAGATPQARLEAAASRVRSLSVQIETQALTMQREQERLAEADARVAEVSGRLAGLMNVRRSARVSLERARAGWEEARIRLSEIVAEAFMYSGGDLDTSVLGAVLGAGSIAELGDRLAFSTALGDEQARAAAEADLNQRRLAARLDGLDLIVAERAALLDELSTARDEQASAIDRQAAAVAGLAATRDDIVRLVGRLTDRVRAAELGGVGRSFQGAYHVSYGEWARRFLEHMQLPDCRANQVVMVAWQVQEFTQAAWNPLATTHRMPGSTDFNGVGVQNFRSLEQGLQATEETLRNGWDVYGYSAIVRELASCSEARTTAAAVNASRWCYGCGGGSYLVGVVPKVEADFRTYADL